MDLEDTDAHRAFRASVRAFIGENRDRAPVPVAGSQRLNPQRYPADVRAWQTLLVEAGLACRTVPREYGGFGAARDILAEQIIVDELFAAGLPTGLQNQGISMLVPTLLAHGSEEQKQDWIRPTIRGDVIWCQGYSEPGAGSDLASLKTRAVADGDDLVINGQKIWTSWAHIADMIFCLVRTGETPRHGGISYLIFPMDLAGIEVRPLMTMAGHASFNEVFFTDVRVPQSAIVGGRGAGWTVANSTLAHERGMLGNANGALWRLNRVREMLGRDRGGSRIGADPLVRDRFVALQARVQALRMHEMRLVSAAAAGTPRGIGDLVVKLAGCELNHALDLMAIDLGGLTGVEFDPDATDDSDRFWQPASMYDLGLIIGGGTAQVQKNIIAERGLDMPREPKLREA